VAAILAPHGKVAVTPMIIILTAMGIVYPRDLLLAEFPAAATSTQSQPLVCDPDSVRIHVRVNPHPALPADGLQSENLDMAIATILPYGTIPHGRLIMERSERYLIEARMIEGRMRIQRKFIRPSVLASIACSSIASMLFTTISARKAAEVAKTLLLELHLISIPLCFVFWALHLTLHLCIYLCLVHVASLLNQECSPTHNLHSLETMK